MQKLNVALRYGYTSNVITSVSDPDPDPVGSAFNLSLDPGSGSVFGIWIRILDPDV